MDIFEAIKVYYSPRTIWGDIHDSEDTLRAKERRLLSQEADKIINNYETYRKLTEQEGRAVALAAIELYDAGTYPDHYIPHQVLDRLASSVPGSLKGLYQNLIERNIFWRESALYREADSATRDLLLLLLESDLPPEMRRGDLLCALAWIGDKKVRAQFNAWHHKQPTWYPSSYYSIQDYARCAGWELTKDGKRRDLCYSECYDLLSADEVAAMHIPNPVEVIAPHEEQCPWCDRSLVTLFDFHLHDHRLSFLGLEGERVRIAMCTNCSTQCVGGMTEIDFYGTSRWSDANGSRPLRLSLYDDLPWPQQQLGLGKARKTPFETDGSHIGGYPEWVQYPEYPTCPLCQQTMMFIGQIEPAVDIGAPAYIEGIVYAFLCATCGKATTGYQQT